MSDQHRADPNEAHRDGLERLQHEPRHPTTAHDKPPHADAPQPAEPPGEQHRGGPLPNTKK